MGERVSSYPPKILWLLWLQGWELAPQVALACRRSWESLNPGWTIHSLDAQTLRHFLPPEIVQNILSQPKEVEALSDQIRLELLHRYGGVWADATAMCAEPLDAWLPLAMPNGFFAFSWPAPDRMISTWFLAAEKGSYIVERWRNACWSYWRERSARDNYFWVHNLFSQVYRKDASFHTLWDETPQRPAAHRFHFGPSSAELLACSPPDLEALLRSPPSPVFKLTHKFESTPAPESLFGSLCNFAYRSPPTRRPAKRRLLVGWYGSFAGHGTIGDLQSLESLVSHLVGRGHEVFHASADPISIAGSIRVDWSEFTPEACDAALFVCGPILRNHPETTAFFDRFSAAELVGIGVSLLPESHCNDLASVPRTSGC
jgi:hypothetical protein